MLYNRKYFPNRFTESAVLLTLILFCSCGIFLFLVNQVPRINLLINRPQWEMSKPLAYRIELKEYTAHRGLCSWAILVQENDTIMTALLHTTQPKRICWLNPKNMNIEKVFDLAGSCASYGLIDCQLEFDPQFHFPNYILYPEVIIEVQNFAPCKQDLSDCRIAEE